MFPFILQASVIEIQSSFRCLFFNFHPQQLPNRQQHWYNVVLGYQFLFGIYFRATIFLVLDQIHLEYRQDHQKVLLLSQNVLVESRFHFFYILRRVVTGFGNRLLFPNFVRQLDRNKCRNVFLLDVLDLLVSE